MYARARLSRKEAAGSSPVTPRPTFRLKSSERSTNHSHGAARRVPKPQASNRNYNSGESHRVRFAKRIVRNAAPIRKNVSRFWKCGSSTPIPMSSFEHKRPTSSRTREGRGPSSSDAVELTWSKESLLALAVHILILRGAVVASICQFQPQLCAGQSCWDCATTPEFVSI
jgi:hypothetical protein